jgi:hypothetical protein
MYLQSFILQEIQKFGKEILNSQNPIARIVGFFDAIK